MLLNLSNHPSHLWDEKQIKSAKDAFGSVADLPFPSVLPDAETGEIEILVKEYLQICLNRLNESIGTSNAVHLMGELTFSFGLAALLQQAGIRCVASTSERKVQSNSQGEKTVKFEFCRFREYPLLISLNNRP
jgi:hypothetical protein